MLPLQLFKNFPELAGHPWYIQVLVRAFPMLMGAIIGTALAFLLSSCAPCGGSCQKEYDCSMADEQEIFEFKKECYAHVRYSDLCDSRAYLLFCKEVPRED